MFTRRSFLASSAATLGSLALGDWQAQAQDFGDRPARPAGVSVLNPRDRVPLSFIIDDSTCLVNLAHFCIPQFAEVFPERYKQDWRRLPREIPDAFVREFGEWCREQGVKGKYSIVPYPACAGWVDREMPGWTKQELNESLKLVRDFMSVDWDIHPEMITHTWAINTKTGRPYDERTENYMENWGFSVGKSVDQLADYMGYALRILKNAGLYCEGITTPGGFGNRVLPELSQATLQACKDVYQTEIPHYFRHLYTGKRSVMPRVEYASGLKGPDPRCVVSIIGCSGDWTGGWDGLSEANADLFIKADLQGGRLPEVIDSGEPAILVCHWAGIYYNGEKRGFRTFQEVVARLNRRYDNLLWMKLSEISRYWAARELTEIRKDARALSLSAPFASPIFTLDIQTSVEKMISVQVKDQITPLMEVRNPRELRSGTWCRRREGVKVCFDLPRGQSSVVWQ